MSDALIAACFGNGISSNDVQELWQSVQPMLSHPDQKIFIVSSKGPMVWLSGAEQKLLSSGIRSEIDLRLALKTHVLESDALGLQVWRSLLSNPPIKPEQALSMYITSNGAKYTAKSHIVTCIDCRSVLTLLTPAVETNFNYADARASAMRYNAEWNSYVSSCQNDVFSEKVMAPMDSASRSDVVPPSEMVEFIPTMNKPELQFYYSMLAKSSSAFFGAIDTAGDQNAPHISMEPQFIDPDRVVPRAIKDTTGQPAKNYGLRSAMARQGVPAAMGDSVAPSQNLVSDKKCQECGVEKSPEWRKGPSGPKTLCNACGLRYAKRLRGGA